MKWLKNILRSKSQIRTKGFEQAVIIVLDGQSLPDEVYENYDTNTLEDLLADALGDLGECDGVEHGPEASRIFVYGPNAEIAFRAIEPILLDYPLAASAKVSIRQGPPGSSERLVTIPDRARL